MSCHRIVGHSLLDRDPPSQSFASIERDTRGGDAGDLVDHAIETRAVLEKSKALESRMKYQIDKLVRLAEGAPATDQNIAEGMHQALSFALPLLLIAFPNPDPLAFRPNVQNLIAPDTNTHHTHRAADNDDYDPTLTDSTGVYRPPKLAPVPYTEGPSTKGKKTRAAPVASTLSSLAHLDPSMPHSESISGLGGGSAQKSSVVRQRLDEMTRFEEDNMTRLLQNKKEASRRKRDEGDIALGGMGGGKARGGGLEEEFDDILKSVGRTKSSKVGDGYEELRQKGKKADVLSRSRTRKEPDTEEDGGRDRKRGRFEKDVQRMKRKGSQKGASRR